MTSALPNSLFIKKKGKATPEWAPRVEHGFSQVVDWFWKLSDLEKTDDFEYKFGARHVTFHGMVIVGRDPALATREQNRLRWRQDQTFVDSHKVSIITFDQLARDLGYRLTIYPVAAKNSRKRLAARSQQR
jgi:hypothetical protein